MKGPGYGYGIGNAFNRTGPEFGRLLFWQDTTILKVILQPKASHHDSKYYAAAVNLDTNETWVSNYSPWYILFPLAINCSAEKIKAILNLHTNITSVKLSKVW